MTQAIKWPAPAKLNLFLYINKKRDDGYHELQTLFQFLDICDYLTITPNHSGAITLSPKIAGLDDPDNLIYKAAMLLKPFTDKNAGAHIELEKNLPMGGGLGGGSSDAATTLVALNYYWSLNLSNQQLGALSLTLGADVPIFVNGHAAIAEGVGEQLTAVFPAESHYLVATPDCHVSTANVFQDPTLIRNTEKRDHVQLMNNNWSNDCEICVVKQYEEVAKSINELIQYAPTRLTGTGSCVFSTFDTLENAKVILDNAPNWLSGFCAKGLNNSPLNTLLTTLK